MFRCLAITTIGMALISVASGCGGDDDAGVPDCASVLRVGADLPAGYSGCTRGNEIVPVLVYDDCDNGKTFLKVDDELGAYEGETISDDPDGLWAECYGYDPETLS